MSDSVVPPTETDVDLARVADAVALEDETSRSAHDLEVGALDRDEDEQAHDVERLASEPLTVCLNCGSVLPGRFCPDCGQKDQPLRQPAHVFIAESISEYFGLDGRLWRSLGGLLFLPGTLTQAYLDGRRSHYLRPLRIYLSATVLFFFLISFADPFSIERSTIILEPTPRDTLISVSELEDRVESRVEVVEASRDLVRSAGAVLEGVSVSSVSAKDSLEAETGRLDELRTALLAAEARIEQAQDEDSDLYLGSEDEDHLVRPTDTVFAMSPSALEALEDTGRVASSHVSNRIAVGLEDEFPDWMKGDLARQMEDATSPSERNLLLAQYQRAILRQIPTALFVVLPIFALLLKVFYLRGGGRNSRNRPRPPSPQSDAPGWVRLLYRTRHVGWSLRQQLRTRKRRRAVRRRLKSEKRTLRGAPRRFAGWVKNHRHMRRLRVMKLRQLRRGLMGQRTRYYSEHLVFALHVHAFTFLVLIPVLIWSSNTQVVVFFASTVPVYFLVAQYRVYKQTLARTLVKSMVLGMIYIVVVSMGTLAAAALAFRLG